MQAAMTCEQFVELVTAYLDGAMTTDEAAHFEDHLALCQGCITLVEQFRETIRLTGRLEPEDISPEAREQLLEAFRDWHAGPEHGRPSVRADR